MATILTPIPLELEGLPVIHRGAGVKCCAHGGVLLLIDEARGRSLPILFLSPSAFERFTARLQRGPHAR